MISTNKFETSEFAISVAGKVVGAAQLTQLVNPESNTSDARGAGTATS